MQTSALANQDDQYAQQLWRSKRTKALLQYALQRFRHNVRA